MAGNRPCSWRARSPLFLTSTSSSARQIHDVYIGLHLPALRCASVLRTYRMCAPVPVTTPVHSCEASPSEMCWAESHAGCTVGLVRPGAPSVWTRGSWTNLWSILTAIADEVTFTPRHSDPCGSDSQSRRGGVYSRPSQRNHLSLRASKSFRAFIYLGRAP